MASEEMGIAGVGFSHHLPGGIGPLFIFCLKGGNGKDNPMKGDVRGMIQFDCRIVVSPDIASEEVVAVQLSARFPAVSPSIYRAAVPHCPTPQKWWSLAEIYAEAERPSQNLASL